MKWIDISHPLNEDTPTYPGDERLTLKKYKTIENDCYCAYTMASGFHTGTHVDIPMHLVKDDRTVAEFSLEHFSGEGLLLDVRGEKIITMKPYYENVVHKDMIVLLFTGYGDKYHDPEYFTNHPKVSEELGEFLISRRIRMLGIDMPSPDYSPFTFHKELLKNDVLVLENLTNLSALVGVREFEVMAFPLKVSAEASFVRAVCDVELEDT